MSNFIRACHRLPTEHTPIWLMRQAGRYQAEYRAIRERVSFLELCKTPALAAEVTLLPMRQFEFDAAIIFADILLLLDPLGVPFGFQKDHGPKIERPVRSSEDIDAIRSDVVPEESLAFVLEAIKIVRAELEDDRALLGFAGAPFTLASYMIEGGSSRHFAETKRFMYADPGAWDTLMTKVTAATQAYLLAQIKAGVDGIQVFDSWVGCLNRRDYDRFVSPYMTQLFAGLPKDVPQIHFATGNPSLYSNMKAAGGTVLGVDWRVDIGAEWARMNHECAIMGNLDPAALLAPREVLLQKADEVIASVEGRPGHIFNLGHGILPSTPPDNVKALVDHVHAKTAKS